MRESFKDARRNIILEGARVEGKRSLRKLRLNLNDLILSEQTTGTTLLSEHSNPVVEEAILFPFLIELASKEVLPVEHRVKRLNSSESSEFAFCNVVEFSFRYLLHADVRHRFKKKINFHIDVG